MLKDIIQFIRSGVNFYNLTTEVFSVFFFFTVILIVIPLSAFIEFASLITLLLYHIFFDLSSRFWNIYKLFIKSVSWQLNKTFRVLAFPTVHMFYMPLRCFSTGFLIGDYCRPTIGTAEKSFSYIFSH